MKKIILVLFLSVFSFSFTYANDIEDNSIIDALDKEKSKEIDFDFSLKSFESCDWLEKVMWKYIKTYWENNKENWYHPMYRTLEWWMDFAMEESVSSELKSISSDSVEQASGRGWSSDYSETNIQVSWVDESDIIKTDWEYIYYYNETDKYVYIVESDNLSIVKKIKLPSTFYNPVLYIWEDRLTIISSWYSDIDYSSFWYWINRNSKTYTIVFDISNIKSPVLSKLYVSDWDLKKSRKIGDYVYVISNNNFSIPYYSFESIDDIDLDYSKFMPKKIDISKTDIKENQNLELRWKDLPYNITAWDIASCSEIEYVLPDEETMKEFNFSPSYNIISVINTKDTEQKVETNVIAGSNSEIYMSLDNLYLINNIYKSYDYKCSDNFRCIVPWYPRGNQTLIHQLSIDGSKLKYSDSTIIPWSPLNQYSMDENGDNFRIITQTNYPKLATNLYILEKDWLDLNSMLEWIEPWEQFKSSRFIWDKLYLVTFKQVDPLFVISMSDWQDPKILWELKIPGYSTYLHPYDENHLIGLGYDTFENEWGWTRNGWIKVDLYEINFDKKCGDDNLTVVEEQKCESWDYKWIIVKQKYSKTWWDAWSYSEALNNPRMFMYKPSENKLFLPVTLYENAKDEEYRHIDFFQGLLTMTINKDNGIRENYRITHLDTSLAEDERKKECDKYSPENLEKKCVKLIWGWEYCEDVKYRYVPKYCYADSPIWEYIASRNWNYRESFVKRALWIDNEVFSISDDMLRSSNINTWIKTWSVIFK